MTTKRKNNMDEVIGEDEQYVLGKRYYYTTSYICKYCGLAEKRAPQNPVFIFPATFAVNVGEYLVKKST